MNKTIFTIICLLFLKSTSFSQNGDYFVYVSSVDKDNGEAIISLDFNSDNGDLKVLNATKDTPNSSYLNISPDKKYIYSIWAEKGGKGILGAYAIDQKTGDLTLINKVSDFGKAPCYVSISNSGKHILVSNYVEGNILSFKKKKNGKIGRVVSNIYHKAPSLVTDRQKSPHPHMILPAPENDLIMVPDLGTDKVMTYQIDKKGKLTSFGTGFGKSPAGGGPRHFAFHPNGKFGYVLNELTGSVTSFHYSPEKGLLSVISTVSGLPEDFKEFNKSADIHFTPNGKFLYTSNRGHNSISVFTVNKETGNHEFKGTFPSGGDWPRAFEVDPSGKFLLVANKETHNIAIFKINQENGFGEIIGEVSDLGAPQCIKFLKK